MMDPIILYYGKGQLTGFLVDPNGVLDVVIKLLIIHYILFCFELSICCMMRQIVKFKRVRLQVSGHVTNLKSKQQNGGKNKKG